MSSTALGVLAALISGGCLLLIAIAEWAYEQHHREQELRRVAERIVIAQHWPRRQARVPYPQPKAGPATDKATVRWRGWHGSGAADVLRTEQE